MQSLDAQRLYEVAQHSIESGARHAAPLEPSLETYSARLCAEGASFVTLKLAGNLRGCIGSLEAMRPLVVDVAQNAFSAAFLDVRFPPVSRRELAALDVEISVLSPSQPLDVASESGLLAALRPRVDGLTLEWGARRATLLPAVWEQLVEPPDFLRCLKQKAGLPPDFWSPELRFSRYQTVSVPRPAGSPQRPDAADAVDA